MYYILGYLLIGIILVFIGSIFNKNKRVFDSSDMQHIGGIILCWPVLFIWVFIFMVGRICEKIENFIYYRD